MDYIEFPFIPQKPSERSVFLRLGYTKNTEVSESEMQRFKKAFDASSVICRPKARCVVLDIVSRDEDHVVLDENIVLESKVFSKMVKDCQSILLMGATIDKNISDRIHHEIKDGDRVFGIMLDAYASECVDDCFDYIIKYCASMFSRQNKKITKRRFSAGYGGMDISHQKEFYDILKMDQLDVEITDSFILLPEKSVTAMAGIQNI